MGIELSGQWLEKALMELSKKMEMGIELDGEIISGLVSYCEMAPPLDAKEYLDILEVISNNPVQFFILTLKGGDLNLIIQYACLCCCICYIKRELNIIGEEAGKSVIEEYLKRRGHSNVYSTSKDTSTSTLHAYIKPRPDEGPSSTSKKAQRAPKEATSVDNRTKNEKAEPKNGHLANQVSSRKKKSGKVISLAEAAKGSTVYRKGKPCSCQARRHRLVSNCLSCGKIVCEQEGEGPCNFCGSLVLKEGSTYAGLDEGVTFLTDAEATAEAYAKRLVEYDRNSAARTTVIDDQSDYYEMEGNSWLSNEEKELLRKKMEEQEETDQAKRNKVVMTFDLLGRKVLLNQDEASAEMENRILLRPLEEQEEVRIKPNPSLKIQPIFIDPGPKKTPEDTNLKKGLNSGLCLEISGRVQYGTNELDVL